MWEKEIGVFPVSWPGQVDEWAYHLARVLCGQDHWIGGLPGDGDPVGPEVILKPPPGSSIRASLRVRPMANGIECVVLDDEGVVSDNDVQLWQDAASSAVAQIGKGHQDFAWHAIVGPHP